MSGLVPDIIPEEKPMWVIIEDTDVVKRRTLTLKQIKHLCEERDIDILGPKGGQLSKKALLERLEADIERIHQEEVDEAHKEASIVKEYQMTKIRVFERELKKLRNEIIKEYDIMSKQQTKCSQLDNKANELRISIKAMKELL
tara:strand:- start:233 stop:661 length:429 start_codon:yes stop_codon:yes gene_type:complete